MLPPIASVKTFVGIMAATLIAVQMGAVNYQLAPDYLTKIEVMIIIVVFFAVSWMAWNCNKTYIVNMLSVFCIVLSLIVGIGINPLQKGLRQVKENPLLLQIKAIDQEDPGIWVTEDMGFPCGNIPLLAGVSSLTATNVYPNISQWTILDPESTQKDIYNRYAHIGITLVNEPTSFVLKGMDEFNVNLNLNDLNKLNIKYLISHRDLTQFNQESYVFEQKLQMEQYKIYKVVRN